MLQTKNFSPRQYQEAIFNTCKDNNTLVVLETGLGKTAIALMLSLYKLSQDLSKKVIILAPSRPLIAQHHRYFKHHSDLEEQDLALITGKIPPQQRKKLFSSSLIIFSTPQCINNDVLNSIISLQDTSLIVFDEAHHAIQNYAYVNIAKVYSQQSPTPHILALTASPGSTGEKIKQLCSNLLIKKTEIRTDQDEDVKPYIQDKKIQWLTIPLDPPLLNILTKIKQFYTQKLKELKKFGITKPINLINKKDLLNLQSGFIFQLKTKNPIAFHGISLTSQLIKTSHLIDILETQGVSTAVLYLEKLRQETTKASSIILSDTNIKNSCTLLKSLEASHYTHPKISSLLAIISQQLSANQNSKIIVFVNFRDTISEIFSSLSSQALVRPVILIGQKQGLNQKEQLQVIKDFENNLYNVLLCTSIGEEGLSIGTLDIAIFYDSVPSAIRRIQRTGRVARIKPGKIIHLMAAGTKDVAYHWSSKRDETRMKNILYTMQGREVQARL